MGIKNWKSEGGSGGKRGHSNMDQWLFNDEMKDLSRSARRLQAEEQIKEHVRDNEDWSVWRQDDLGQKYEIARCLSLDEAKRRAAELESHGHKQTYWVERTA